MTSTAIHQVVETALRAPSIHNTQPWRWRITGRQVELFADRRRLLDVIDPSGRNLVVSCGTALHHAEVAASALGWSVRIERFPEGTASTLLARVHLSPGSPPKTAVSDLRAIEERRTDRRKFTSWPVPEETLWHLAQAAMSRGTHAVPVVDLVERFRAEVLVERALEHQVTRPDVVREQDAWIDRSPVDGIPSDVLPTGGGTGEGAGRMSRFPSGTLGDEGRAGQVTDGMVLVYDPADTPRSWLLAGEGLSAMWLAATRSGLSVVPLSQVVEVEDTRRDLAGLVLAGLGQPQILARVGWQMIGRSDLHRTSRRSLDDVLDPG